MEPLFSDEEVRRLEEAHPAGLSAAAVLELLRQRGLVLSEATFRKYVQLGLLPRSRRVGRKGKHRGSHGLYPAACVGRVADIRALMDRGQTLEDIRRSALGVGLDVEQLRRGAEGALARLEEELARRRLPSAGLLARRLEALRARARELAEGFEAAAQAVCASAPEGAEEPPPREAPPAVRRPVVRPGARAARRAREAGKERKA